MAATGGNRAGSQSRSWIGWVPLALIIAGVVAAVVVAKYAISRTPSINKATLCQTDGPTAVTAILIDATDSISDLQRLAIENRLIVLLKELRPNERVEVFSIRPGADPLKPVFSMCRPANADETSSWTANKNDADKRFSGEFKPALKDTLERLLDARPAPSSPIMESVQAASVRSLRASDLRSSEPGFRRRLILISDLMQNSQALSQLSDPGSWEQFRKSGAMGDVSSDLSETTVTVLYLNRDNSVSQGMRHAAFWDAWLTEQGAANVNMIPIEG